MEGLQQAAKLANIPLSTNHVCGMFGLFFTTRRRCGISVK